MSDALASRIPPHVHLVVATTGDDVAAVSPAPPGFVVRTVDGRRARTKAALIDALARAFALPASTGRNWDALEEALADLEWLPARGYALIVTHADALLADAPADDYRTFVGLVEDVGREWAKARTGQWPRAAAPFHAWLVVAADREQARADWIAPKIDR